MFRKISVIVSLIAIVMMFLSFNSMIMSLITSGLCFIVVLNYILSHFNDNDDNETRVLGKYENLILAGIWLFNCLMWIHISIINFLHIFNTKFFELNNIQREIIFELVDNLLKKLEEEPTFNYYDYSYGQLGVSISSLGNIYIRYLSNNKKTYVKELYTWTHLNERKIITIFDSKLKKQYKKRHNKLYHLLKERDKLMKKQEDIEKNKEWISYLPEERQKQLYRSVKLERIINEDEN